MFHRGSKKPNARTGSALAAVLVCVVVALIYGAALTQTLVVQHRQVRLSEQQQQSFWLAESAVQRTVHTLKTSPDYRGETWKVPAEVLGAAGIVVIEVESVDAPQTGWSVRVASRFPDAPKHRIIYERELFVPKHDAGTPAAPQTETPDESEPVSETRDDTGKER